MKNMTLKNIAAACGGKLFCDEACADREIMGAVIDSRQVEEGFLYVAMKGERVDGHTFIPSTFEKGAACALSEVELENPAGPYILVESTPIALKDIAEFYRAQLDTKIIGIVGSVGKTSTKEMVAAVLAEKYNVLKTEGNFNNEIGLPLTLLRIRDEHQVAVVEMGISDFGEMHRLSKMARPDICIMTNIGQCHLENLIDRNGILRAKSEVYDFMKSGSFAILNGNDDKLSTLKNLKGMDNACLVNDNEDTGINIIRYFVEDGTSNHMNDAYKAVATGIENLGLEGMHCTITLDGVALDITEPIPGSHNVYNACAAACAGRILGLKDDEIIAGLSHAKTIAGRTNLIKANGIMVIDDCYNANPVSMKASLDVLSLAAGRKIAVLGDMGELGENEVALHEEVGEYAASKHIDVVCCTGELSKHIAEKAEAGCGEVLHLDTKEEIIDALLASVEEGDTILVKASHFMNFTQIVKALTK